MSTFIYDALGPSALVYNGTTYYYVRNVQGDITGIVDASGGLVETYIYDAWGNPLNVPATEIGMLNPFRYRGYVYDQETGLYYLQSRYYSPSLGRFFNADGYVSTGQGLLGNNMFAYCGNNPANRKDESGEFWNYVIGGVVGGLISGITTYVQTGSVKKALIAGAVGAVNGVIAASGFGIFAQAGLSMVASGVGDLVMQTVGEEKAFEDIDWIRVGHNSALGGTVSVLGSGLGSLTSYGQTSTGKELINAAKDKLLTGYVRQSAGQSSSALLRQGQKLFTQGIRYVNTGRGISSVTGSILTWAPSTKFAMS